MDPMPPMLGNPPPSPPPAARRCDPLAAALGNASLLGVGYVLLGRWWFALGAAVGSVGLLLLAGSVQQPVWPLVALALWWVGATAHGWYLASRTSVPDTVRKQRLIALGTVLAVLLVLGGLRWDAGRIEAEAAEAHANNECRQALSTLDGLWVGHRAVDPTLAGRTADSVRACELLLDAERQAESDRLLAAASLKRYRAEPGALWEGANGRRAELFLAQATAELDLALGGDSDALPDGFDNLATVLREYPDRAAEVEHVLAGFVDGLPTENACETRQITDWLGARPSSEDELDSASDVVPRVAPAALVGCGDTHLERGEAKSARTQYEQLLDEYPDHDLADRAERGAYEAKLAIQLARIQRLLAPTYGYGKPEYCRNPAPYAGAEPYKGDRTNRAMMFGNGGNKAKLPSSWLTDDPAKAVLVICAGDVEFGSAVETCPYTKTDGGGGTYYVTFRNRKIPVKVYEVRTGKRVSDHSVQIGGDSCPYSIFFFGTPPSNRYVDSDKYDVREAYGEVIDP